jgi:hypothetical protein
MMTKVMASNGDCQENVNLWPIEEQIIGRGTDGFEATENWVTYERTRLFGRCHVRQELGSLDQRLESSMAESIPRPAWKGCIFV